MTSPTLISLYAITCLFVTQAKSQIYQRLTLDSTLMRYSEQLGIGNNGRTDGFKLATIGPYVTNFAHKIDSGSFHTKVKEDQEFFYGGTYGFEEFKIKKIDQQTFYRIGVTFETDSATGFFSLHSSVKKRSETVLSVILSKKEESTPSQYFAASKEVGGFISINNDSAIWRFQFYFPSSAAYGIDNDIRGLLTHGVDSFYLKVVYSEVFKTSKKEPFDEKIVMRSGRGYTLADQGNRQMSALIFKQTSSYIGAQKSGNFTNGEQVIIGKENSKETRLAMATIFSILIGI